MSPLIARAESILGQLAAIREAAIRGPFSADLLGTWITALDGHMRICDLRGWGYLTAVRKLTDEQAAAVQGANASAIVVRINGWQADEDLVRGMLFLCCFADEAANERLEITGSYGAFDEPGSVEISRGQLLRWCERWEEVLKGVA